MTRAFSRVSASTLYAALCDLSVLPRTNAVLRCITLVLVPLLSAGSCWALSMPLPVPAAGMLASPSRVLVAVTEPPWPTAQHVPALQPSATSGHLTAQHAQPGVSIAAARECMASIGCRLESAAASRCYLPSMIATPAASLPAHQKGQSAMSATIGSPQEHHGPQRSGCTQSVVAAGVHELRTARDALFWLVHHAGCWLCRHCHMARHHCLSAPV